MAKGDFFLKLMIADWLNDPNLRALKRENRDTWLTVCLLMKREGVYKFTGTKDVLARKFFISIDEFDDFIEDLEITKAADIESHFEESERDMSRAVTKKDKIFTVVSRRFKRDDKVKEQNRLRKERQRNRDKSRSNHENVTSPIITSYKNTPLTPQGGSDDFSENSETENRRLDPEPMIQVVRIVTGITAALNVKQLPNKPTWTRAAEWAISNDFSAEDFLECFSLMRQQKWRNGAIKPMTVVENLPELEKLRRDVANQQPNGNGPPAAPPVPFVPTYCDVCRSDDGFLTVIVDGSPKMLKCKHDPEQLEGLELAKSKNVTT